MLAFGLTLLTGVFCIVGGLLRLGAIANFLSRPILVGYLNGIALSIMAGQLGKLCGFRLHTSGIVRPVLEFLRRRNEAHEATVVLGLALLALLIALKYVAPRWPGPLIAVVAGAGVAFGLGLEAHGVQLVGHFSGGIPRLHLPLLSPGEWHELLPGAMGIAVVSFCSGMLTARSFATRRGGDIDANQEFIAFGVADVLSGLSQGFAVTGADSRTAVNDTMGGQTQLVGIVAAACTALVLLFATAPFAYVPETALAAVLILAGYSLLDLRAWLRLWSVSRPELWLSLVTTLAVIGEGVLEGILIAVGLAVIRLLVLGSRPSDAVLGRVPGLDGFHNVATFDQAETIPGLVIYRFESALLFFNADYFKRRVLDVVSTQREAARCLLLDAEGMNRLDITGADTLSALQAQLAARGIVLLVARAPLGFVSLCERAGLAERIGHENFFPTLRTAVQRFLDGLPKGGEP